MKLEIKKRTFEALKWPLGSKERDALNRNPITSEFAEKLYNCTLVITDPTPAFENIESFSYLTLREARNKKREIEKTGTE